MLFSALVPALCVLFTTTSAELPPRHLIKVNGVKHLPSATNGPAPDSHPSAIASGTPDPLTATGTGCSTGTVAPSFNDNATVLTLIFNDMIADIGPNVPRERRRRFCNVDIRMEVPQGWKFEVDKVDWRGFVDLDKDVRGVLSGNWFWRGEQEKRGDKVTIRKTIDGPFHDSYLKHKDGEKDRSLFLPCITAAQASKEQTMNINTIIRLNYVDENDRKKDRKEDPPRRQGGAGAAAAGAKNNGQGSITVDSLDASFKQVLNLNWQRC